MKNKKLLKQNIYNVDGFFISKDKKLKHFFDYKVYAGKLPEYLEKTENEMTEAEKAFDAKIYHYFESRFKLLEYHFFESIEHNFVITHIHGIIKKV